MIEKYLIEHCAPTLDSLKTANLFTYHFEAEEDICKYLNIWNTNFKNKGIELILLKKQDNFALIYVCRKARLQKDLNKAGVAEFLAEYGYEDTNADYAINRLKTRLTQSNSFPHEIGIFLDYPLGDVIGFIDNAGANCKCIGCWKVYCNECEAIRTFAKYKKCKEVYTRLWSEEKRNILQLTVAV